MDAPGRRDLIERYIAAYNAFDVEGMLATLSAEVAFLNFSSGQLTAQSDGKEAFRRLAEQGKALFSEREQTIVSVREDGESTIVDIAYRGRLAVDIPDGPAAGTLIELTGQSEFSFGEGCITRLIDRS